VTTESKHADVHIYGEMPLHEYIPTPRGENGNFSNMWAAVNETEFKRKALDALIVEVDELWEALVEYNQQEAAP